MSIALACTWRPQGETPRLRALSSRLSAMYSDICIGVLDAAEDDIEALRAIPQVRVIINLQRGMGRYAVMQRALETEATHIHYADMDRMLRWMETNADDLQKAVETIPQTDCLILGRSERAFATHPHTLQETEKIINMVCSHLLNRPVDLGGGSRGFSRRAAQFLLAHSAPGRWGDAEWPILLHRAGFAIDYLAVDGLDWETADRHQSAAAGAEAQRQLAEKIDQDARRWASRVRIAQEIIQEGLTALTQPLSAQDDTKRSE